MLTAGMIKMNANAKISFVRIFVNTIVLPLQYELFLTTIYFVQTQYISSSRHKYLFPDVLIGFIQRESTRRLNRMDSLIFYTIAMQHHFLRHCFSHYNEIVGGYALFLQMGIVEHVVQSYNRQFVEQVACL